MHYTLENNIMLCQLHLSKKVNAAIILMKIIKNFLNLILKDDMVLSPGPGVVALYEDSTIPLFPRE